MLAPEPRRELRLPHLAGEETKAQAGHTTSQRQSWKPDPLFPSVSFHPGFTLGSFSFFLSFSFLFFFVVVVVFVFSMAAPMAYGGSQARGLI